MSISIRINHNFPSLSIELVDEYPLPSLDSQQPIFLVHLSLSVSLNEKMLHYCKFFCQIVILKKYPTLVKRREIGVLLKTKGERNERKKSSSNIKVHSYYLLRTEQV